MAGMESTDWQHFAAGHLYCGVPGCATSIQVDIDARLVNGPNGAWAMETRADMSNLWAHTWAHTVFEGEHDAAT